MKIKMVKERETKNTVRYTELPHDDGSPLALITQYVQKTALKEEFEGFIGTGTPEYLYITIEAG